MNIFYQPPEVAKRFVVHSRCCVLHLNGVCDLVCDLGERGCAMNHAEMFRRGNETPPISHSGLDDDPTKKNRDEGKSDDHGITSSPNGTPEDNR